MRCLWISLVLAAACAPQSGWELEERPVAYQPPPGVGGLTLSGPSQVAPGETYTWRASAPDLPVGLRVHMGWGGEIGAGPCPFRGQVGGWLCMDIRNPARHLTSTTVVDDPEVPGGGLALFEFPVPQTSLDQVHLQVISLDGLDSATSNVWTVNFLEPDVPLCSMTAGPCVDDNDLVFWVRADGEGTDGAPVSTWTDLSTASNDASQSDSAHQPTYIADGIGSRGVMRFDGDDRLDVLTNVLAAGTDPYTVFVVLRPDSLAGHIVGTGSSGAGFARTFGNSVQLDDGRSALKSNSNSAGLYMASKARVDATPHILTAVASSTGSTLFVDGRASGTSAAALQGHNYTKATIGASDGSNNDSIQDAFTGDIAEILVFHSELPDAEREKVEEGLAGFYGIPLAVDAGCDGVPGSTAAYDVCGVCEGDGTTCGIVDEIGPSLWLRADDLAGGPDLVSTWLDASPSANDASQPAADLQPCFAPQGLSDHGAIYFDGTNDRLDLLSHAFAPGSTPKTVMVVLESNDTNAHLVGSGSSSAGFTDSYGHGMMISGGKPALKANSASSGTYAAGSVDIDSGPHIVTAIIDSDGGLLYVDGGFTGASTTAPNAHSYTKSTLGASDGSESNASADPFSGWLAEVLVFDQALSSEDRVRIEAYLGTRYDIARHPEGTVLGERLWLHADDVGHLPDGTPLGLWADRSGAANDAAQGTASMLPTVQTGASGPVVRFDGTNDRLDLASNIFSDASYPMTVFAVVSSAADSGHIVGFGSSGAGFLTSYGSGLFMFNGSAGAKANSNNSGQFMTSFGAVNDSNLHVISYVADNNGAELYVDGGFQGSTVSTPNAHGYSRSTVGASDGSASNATRDPFDGDIAEIRVYGLPLGETHRQAVEVELATDHGITLAPPGSSLFQDLELFWRMDESGSGARIDIMKGVGVAPWPPDAAGTTPTPGKVGDGQLVDGPNGYHFWRADTAALDHGGDSFTWLGWIRIDSLYDSQTFVGKWEYNENFKEYRIYYDTGRSTWAFEVSATGFVGPADSIEVLHSAPLVLGEWVFIEAWHDAENDEVGFRVGNESAMGSAVTAPWSLGVNDYHDDLNFAAHNQCADDHLHGAMDAIGYWSRVLTAAERDAVWNNGDGWEP